MNAYNRIKQWFVDREDHAWQAAYNEGYGWVCAELLLHRKTEDEVEANIEGQKDPFDLGARDALREIPKQMKKPTPRRSKKHSVLPYVSLGSVAKIVDKLPIPEQCGNCGERVELVNNTEIYGREYGTWPYAYRCIDTRGCGSHVALHKGTDLPLGTLADRETRDARTANKPAFNAVLKHQNAGRGKTYQWLAEQLDIPVSVCHWAMFDAATAERAGELCHAYLSGRNTPET